MADEPKSETDDDNEPKPEDKPAPKGADDVEKLKVALRKANKEAEQSRLKLKELEDRDKTESEKLSGRISEAEKRASEAEIRALRLEVAAEKGLTAAQARRLVGASKDELESDADELLETFGTSNGDDKPKPTDRPKERLSGGGDPTEEPAVDIRKMVDDIPRGF